MQNQTETMIEVKKLVKKYGSFTAVNGIDFSVKKGKFSDFSDPMVQENRPL